LPSKGIASTPPPKGEARSSSTAEKAREARTSGAAADKAALIEKLEKLQEEAASIRQRLDRQHNLELGGSTTSSPRGEEEAASNRSSNGERRSFFSQPPRAEERSPVDRRGKAWGSGSGSLFERLGKERSASAGGLSGLSGGLRRMAPLRNVAAVSSGWMSFGPRLSTAVPSRTSANAAAPVQQDLLAMLRRGRKRAQYSSRGPAEEAALYDGPLRSARTRSAIRLLPRGGAVCETRHGPIQFGAPPETIKDAMQLGAEVPRIFVVGKERFNLRFGTNMADFEFPGFYNFFLKGSQTTVVGSAEALEEIRQVMHETLEGPAPDQYFQDDEYSPFCDPAIYAARPDLHKEICFFKEPRNGRRIAVETLFALEPFQERPEEGDKVIPLRHKIACGLEPEALAAAFKFEETKGWVAIVDRGDWYDVLADGEVVASVPDWLASAMPDPPYVLMPTVSVGPPAFEAPEFGITVLGAADGFAKSEATAGFILWMRGRGVLVDPPAHSAHFLRLNGISSRRITHVILTHTHSDHDAGTFQKILIEQRVTVLTTRTIMAAFVRK